MAQRIQVGICWTKCYGKFMSRCLYENPESTQTLQQGLEEYYRVNPEFNGTGDFLGQPRKTVIAHDVCHIVFGLGGTSEEELIVECMTAFGCRMTVTDIYKIPKTKLVIELWKTFGPWRLAKRFFWTTPRMIRAIWMTLHMKKKWPHFEYEQYRGMPLKDLREEFGIRLPV